MNSTLNKNLHLFQNRFPALHAILEPQINLIKENGIPSFWQISEAKSGDKTCLENILVPGKNTHFAAERNDTPCPKTIHLHSAYNPVREAQNYISCNSDEIQNKSATVFYGFGLGYHAIQWAKKFGNSEKKLILLEPDANHFLASLCILDWAEVFEIPELILGISCPAESVLNLIENPEKINIGNEGVSDCFFADIAGFEKHDEAYFSNVKEIIKRNLKKNEINAATLKKFGKLWTRNSEINKKWLGKLSSINHFENAFSTDSENPFKFIVVGAGPTLQHSISRIKDLKKRFGDFVKIICVETALHHLLRNNMTPDFIILSDPQFWAYRHICGLSAPESILITDISVYPAVFNFHCKEILLMSAQFPLAKQFERESKISLADLGTGGSVASVAFNFAVMTGCKEIYLAGIDFSFPYNQSHVKGSSAEQTFHTASNRIKTAENYTASALYSANPQECKDYNGKSLLTDSRMKMFAWWFESRISALNDVKVFSLSADSLFIPNVRVY